MSKRHPWDEAADEVSQWLTESPAYYAEAMKGGYDAPFGAKTTEEQKLEYYKRQAFEQNMDGSPDFTKPNTAGRQMLIDRLGINGYTQVMAAIMPRKVVAQAYGDVQAKASVIPDEPEPRSY